MATSDLANELARDTFRFDNPGIEKQVSDVVLTQLEDASGDISGLAVKCLGFLVNRNQTEQLQAVVAALCDKLLTSPKEQQRDVASLGLKTVVAGGRLQHWAPCRCCGMAWRLPVQLSVVLTQRRPRRNNVLSEPC
jgi:hypothetical protein